MISLMILLGTAAVSGLVAVLAIRRWQTAGGAAGDPSAPQVTDETVERQVARRPRLRTRLRSLPNPASATSVALGVVAAVFVVAATVIGTLAAMVSTKGGLTRFDPKIASFVATHQTSAAHGITRVVTLFGGATVIVPLALVVGIVESRRIRERAVWPFLFIVIAAQFLIANTIKFLVDRARPTLNPLTGFSGTSFPSGHATAAAATYAAFALLIGRRRAPGTRAMLTGIAVFIAVAIAGTRVLLGVHWFTDVIAGVILGWAWFAICSIAFGGRYLRFGAPVEKVEAAISEKPRAVDVTGTRAFGSQ